MATEYKLSYTASEIDEILGTVGENTSNIYQLQTNKADRTELESAVSMAMEDEKGSIVKLLIDELQGLPVFGIVDENNTITITSQLSSGVYTLKYEDEDGALTDVGAITIGVSGEEIQPTYTNLFNPAEASLNTRYSLGGGTLNSAATGYVLSAEIPCTLSADTEKILRIRGADNALTNGNSAVCYFLSNHEWNLPTDASTNGYAIKFVNTTVYNDDNGDSYVKLGYTANAFDSALADNAYIRIQLYISSSSITTDDIQNIIITIDEPITD